jgi:hypothetical protein
MLLRWLAIAALLFLGVVFIPPRLDLQKIRSSFFATFDPPPLTPDPSKTISVKMTLTEENLPVRPKGGAPKTMAPVDSVPFPLQRDLTGWTLRKENAGHLDSVLLESGQALPLGPTIAVKGLLEVRGWAGEPFLGMRMRQVVIVYCGQVVAGAPVEDARADVAEKVHPNLTRAGWRIWISSGHLSRKCREGHLTAWAIGSVGTDLWPLVGQLNLSLSDESESPDENLISLVDPPTPERQPLAQSIRMSVVASALRLRRCAGVSCDPVGSVAKGSYDALVLDDSESGWLLVQFAGQAGWLDRRYVTIGK